MTTDSSFAAVQAHDAPGWYGKLSSLGDFAQRRLPEQWIEACDAWLSQAMVAGSERLGERWLEMYLGAPLLRFAWAPGVMDAQWWFGVLMPSCDNVGRYFPLVVAHPRGSPPEDGIALDHLELWFDHLANAALGTLSSVDTSADALDAALHCAPPWPTSGRTPSFVARSGRNSEHLHLGRAGTLSQWMRALAAQQLSARLDGCTVWWRVTESGAEDAIHIVRGLPSSDAFVTLLGADERDD